MQQLLHTVSVCLWPLLSITQCACTIFSFVVFLSVLNFPHYLINDVIFETILEQKMYILFSLIFCPKHKTCILIFSTNLSETLLILRIERDAKRNAIHWTGWKVPVFLPRIQLNINFLYRFSKNIQISNFMKSCPVGAELFHAGRRTDRHDDDKSRFSKFCESAYKCYFR